MLPTSTRRPAGNVEPAERRTQVRERAQVAVRLRHQPLGELAGRRIGLVALVHERDGDTRDSPELDADDVVEYAPAVREPGGISPEQPVDARLVPGRRDRHVESQLVGLDWAGVVLEAGDDARRKSGEQDGLQVGPRLLEG